jgi:beta-lactamase class A
VRLAILTLLVLVQSSGVDDRFAQAAAKAVGKVGVSVLIVETGETASLNPAGRFPMQSVYKLPIGMAVLNMIDRGTLSLGQKVRVSPAEFVSRGQYSPIRDRFPKGTELTIDQLLEFTLAQSDGTGSDVLLRLAGGPEGVMRYLQSIGVSEVIVATTEQAMGKGDQSVQYRNWSTPRGMVSVLKAVHEGRGLSTGSRRLLLNWMQKVTRGEGRIKGLLPRGTVAARRTGSSGTIDGFTAATNDVGILTLPNGRHMLIAVFVSDARAGEAERERAIAEIARAAWDHFGGR